MTSGRRHAMRLALASVLALRHQLASAQATIPDRWHPGDDPPDVDGVHLGDPRAKVALLLGEPEASPLADDPSQALRTLRYRGGALLIAFDPSDTVARIMLRQAEGGALAGIRVGDRLGAMVTRWGEPTQSRGSVGRYQMGAWTITARVDFGEQKVLKLMLARTPPQPPADPAPPQPAQ